MNDLGFVSTIVLLAELEKRHIAMLFIGLPPSSHNDTSAGDCKIVKDLKGSSLLIMGMCEMMKQAALIRCISSAEFGKDLDD